MNRINLKYTFNMEFAVAVFFVVVAIVALLLFHHLLVAVRNVFDSVATRIRSMCALHKSIERSQYQMSRYPTIALTVNTNERELDDER